MFVIYLIVFISLMAVLSMFWKAVTKFWYVRLVGVSKAMGYAEAVLWAVVGIFSLVTVSETVWELMTYGPPERLTSIGTHSLITTAIWSGFFVFLAMSSHIQLNNALRAHEGLKDELLHVIGEKDV